MPGSRARHARAGSSSSGEYPTDEPSSMELAIARANALDTKDTKGRPSSSVTSTRGNKGKKEYTAKELCLAFCAFWGTAWDLLTCQEMGFPQKGDMDSSDIHRLRVKKMSKSASVVSSKRKTSCCHAYTMYEVEVKHGGKSYVRYRRYKQFEALHKKLLSKVKNPEVREDLQLPAKITIGNLNEEVVAERETELDKYLHNMLTIPTVSESKEVLSFLELPYQLEEPTSSADSKEDEYGSLISDWVITDRIDQRGQGVFGTANLRSPNHDEDRASSNGEGTSRWSVISLSSSTPSPHTDDIESPSLPQGYGRVSPTQSPQRRASPTQSPDRRRTSLARGGLRPAQSCLNLTHDSGTSRWSDLHKSKSTATLSGLVDSEGARMSMSDSRGFSLDAADNQPESPKPRLSMSASQITPEKVLLENFLLEKEIEVKNRILEQMADKQSCKICMDSEICTMFEPCGHLVACGSCAAKSLDKPCPICRRTVEANRDVFF